MKYILTAIRLSTSDSIGGLRRLVNDLFFYPKGFPPGLAVAGQETPALPFPTFTTPETFEDKKSEGFLWGVPKRRRSVEKRLTRRFGAKNWVWKMLIPKYNLLVCDSCGHHYQAKHLCQNCYEKTVAESKLIRESVEAKFGHSAVDKDVIVLYDSDKSQGLSTISTTSTQNKMIVELPKARPSFFSPNLLQRSTIGLNKKAKDVAPTDPTPIVHKTE